MLKWNLNRESFLNLFFLPASPNFVQIFFSFPPLTFLITNFLYQSLMLLFLLKFLLTLNQPRHFLQIWNVGSKRALVGGGRANCRRVVGNEEVDGGEWEEEKWWSKRKRENVVFGESITKRFGKRKEKELKWNLVFFL